MTPHVPGPGHPIGINPEWHLDRPGDDVGVAALTVDLPTAASTHEFGRVRLAPLLQPGDLVVVSGRLGIGKTALIQGVGVGLEVGEPVLSPTFVIARVHRGGRIPLVHVDAYRLGSVLEIDDLDLDADVAASVTMVEWGEGLVEQLADEHLLIELTWGLSSGGLPANRQEGDRSAGLESGGYRENRQADDPNDADEPRSARLTPYGPGWRARLARTRGCLGWMSCLSSRSTPRHRWSSLA